MHPAPLCLLVLGLAAEAPRINHPRIFGVRPGSPFLFRVPVSGTPPLRVSAEGLPQGLVLDAATGVVRGQIQDRAKRTHQVRFRAENAEGSVLQTVRFVVGDRVALTPPMGWNSWYVWSEGVTEAKIREAADAFERFGLAGHGWTYLNIDDCWQGERGGPERALQPNAKFPDMAGMVDYLHAKGLKAGLYTVPMVGSYAGFPGSSASNPDGTYAGLPPEQRLQPAQVFGRYPGYQGFGADRIGTHWFFDADVRQMASWGFDFLKVDWNPIDLPTAGRISRAFRAVPRDIVLSLSNDADPAKGASYAELAEMWRTTEDIQDRWASIHRIAQRQGAWAAFAGPGHWNDPDMLLVGRTNTANQLNTASRPTRLSREEQRTQLTLWSMFAAPLILSCDLARLDGFTLALLTNDEVLAVSQDPLGRPCAERPALGPLRIYRRELEDGTVALAVVNTGDEPSDQRVPWGALGLSGPAALRDLWNRVDLPPDPAGVEVTLPPHASLMVRTFLAR